MAKVIKYLKFCLTGCSLITLTNRYKINIIKHFDEYKDFEKKS